MAAKNHHLQLAEGAMRVPETQKMGSVKLWCEYAIWGLLFYDEHEAMAGWQLAMQILGTCVIFVGIGVGRITPRGHEAASARVEGDKA